MFFQEDTNHARTCRPSHSLGPTLYNIKLLGISRITMPIVIKVLPWLYWVCVMPTSNVNRSVYAAPLFENVSTNQPLCVRKCQCDLHIASVELKGKEGQDERR